MILGLMFKNMEFFDMKNKEIKKITSLDINYLIYKIQIIEI